ncbi:ribosomal large subunit pseudouridine synthase D [Thiogranum longum]|uniref:Pseudouridine synthase n=1 Tax=Thiogranum longum TaxID=1537524 RepID=A0A4R1HAY1_9GAMM|nr:23S rRNA pseudouridine(1911/1915/1917) synthase RluD [Thiogranum longum]TCK17345.1 ribosomal large subunit pseudouridine synthase D [Thiogranum longum]
MSETIYLNGTIPEQAAGRRLDQVLAELFSRYSRSRLQQWTKQGHVLLDGKPATVRQRVLGGEAVEVRAELQEEGAVEAENIELDIVYQDEQVMVINKPAGLVVHPAAGNRAGTLQNALLYLDPALATVPRAGIVHRLDKDTSGLMVVARTLEAHTSLVGQLQARSVGREYLALVHTVLTAGGTVDAPIGRHPKDRLRMAVVESGKPAVSHYRVLERFTAHTLVQVRLETGRTHQIRVHMAHIHCPLVGDPVYGGRLRIPRGASERLREALQHFRRQALHARRLAFVHPQSGETVSWEVEPPEDFAVLLDVVRAKS